MTLSVYFMDFSAFVPVCFNSVLQEQFMTFSRSYYLWLNYFYISLNIQTYQTKSEIENVRNTVDVGQCMGHLQVAVYLSVCTYACVFLCLVLTFCLNASVIVLLCIHAQCACACVFITYAVIQLLSTWSLRSCVIIYAAHWLFCHVECSESLEREAHLTATKGCPADWFVLVHTHTNTHYTPHYTTHYAADTWSDVCVHAHTFCLRVCHSSPERLLGLVLLPVSIVAQAEYRDQYVDYGGELTPLVLCQKLPRFLTPLTFTLSTSSPLCLTEKWQRCMY